LVSVHCLNDIEAPDNAIASANRQHITSVVEVNCEDSSTQIGNSCTGLEVVASVKDLCFVGTCASGHDQITSSLQELSGVDLAALLAGWRLKGNLFAELSGSRVPQLQLRVVLIRTCEDVAVVDIY
jgi:hypothetical protein